VTTDDCIETPRDGGGMMGDPQGPDVKLVPDDPRDVRSMSDKERAPWHDHD